MLSIECRDRWFTSGLSWDVRSCVWCLFFFFSSRRRHTRCSRDWSSDVCSSDLGVDLIAQAFAQEFGVTLDAAPPGARPVERDVSFPSRATLFWLIFAGVFVLAQLARRRGRRGRRIWWVGGGWGGGGWGGGGGGGGGGGFGGFGGGGGFSGGGAGGRV